MVTVLVVKCSFCSVSFCSSIDIFNEAIILAHSLFFTEEAIFLPLCLRNNFPFISQAIPIQYLWAKSSPKIGCCYNLVHTTMLCIKLWSSIFKYNGAIPIGPNVASLTVFTLNGFLIMLILYAIFLKICCERTCSSCVK